MGTQACVDFHPDKKAVTIKISPVIKSLLRTFRKIKMLSGKISSILIECLICNALKRRFMILQLSLLLTVSV